MAAYIVNHVLGGGTFSSRLYREVREKRGLAYGVSDSLVWLKSTAVMIGGTATRADSTADALAVIEQEVKRMAEEGPTADELRGRSPILKALMPCRSTPPTRSRRSSSQIQIDNLGSITSSAAALIDAVTMEDAKRVAKRLFGSGLLVTVAGSRRA